MSVAEPSSTGPGRRPGDQAQGGPAADHRAARRYVDDINAHRPAVGGVRALARGAREDRLDRHVGREGARRRPRRLHRRRPRPGGRRCRWRGCRRASRSTHPPHWALAKDEVNHVGDPVALVDRLRPLRGGRRRRAGHRRVRPAAGRHRPRGGARGRLPARARASSAPTRSTSGRWAAAISRPASREADVIVERRVVNHRTAGAAIEPRGVLAEYRGGRADASGARPRSRTSCGCSSRSSSASARSACASIAPEVGGGFGSKLQIYAEEIGCAWASRKLGRAVKWIETRSEGMMVTHHGRDQIDYVQGRRQARRHDHRLAHEDHRRPRRVPDAADAD